MKLKKVGLLSAGEVCGVASALLGLIIGVLNFISTLGLSALPLAVGLSSEFSNIFGTSALNAGVIGIVGGIILIPIFIIVGGILGFINGIMIAIILNIGLKVAGGLELNLEEKDGG